MADTAGLGYVTQSVQAILTAAITDSGPFAGTQIDLRSPREILDKKKVGLEIPYSRWLRAELKDLVDRYLGPARLAESGLFSPSAVQRLVSEHQHGQVDHGRALWGLLNYMMWLELYEPNPA